MNEPLFSDEQALAVYRTWAGHSAIERTPEECRAALMQMIADYRGWNPELTEGKTDREVWNLICVNVFGLSDEPGQDESNGGQ